MTDRDLDIRVNRWAYPAQLCEDVVLSTPQSWRLRPIRPDDTDRLADMLKRCEPDDVRAAFMDRIANSGLAAMAGRLSQIDYDREMTFVAETSEGGTSAIGGLVRLASDPASGTGELVVLVRSDLHNRTLGRRLTAKALAWARSKGMSRVVGETLPGDGAMIALVRAMGGSVSSDGDWAETLVFRFDLRGAVDQDHAPAPQLHPPSRDDIAMLAAAGGTP